MNPDPARPDQELMARVRDGDRRAFETLYSRYGSPVMRFLFRLCGDRALAEDLTQDVFLKVWNAAAGWRPIGRVSTWLFQIAKHHWWNEAAKRRRRAAIEDAAPLLPEDAPARDVFRAEADATNRGGSRAGDTQAGGTKFEDAIVRAEATEAVVRALADLSPKLRVVFVLVRLEGVSYAETAEIVGVPVGTVKSRAAAAEAFLRKRLKRRFDP